jgi:prepilin-type N-terminal cleavage/methylation domain-containing protein
MRPASLRAGTRTGLTITELLVSVTIILILSSVSTVAYTGLQRRAERLSCTGNLRALHAALSGYVLAPGRSGNRQR